MRAMGGAQVQPLTPTPLRDFGPLKGGWGGVGAGSGDWGGDGGQPGWGPGYPNIHYLKMIPSLH